jgi:hypothetical protein
MVYTAQTKQTTNRITPRSLTRKLTHELLKRRNQHTHEQTELLWHEDKQTKE